MIIACFCLAAATAGALGYILFLKRKINTYETVMCRILKEKMESAMNDEKEDE